MQHGGVVFRAGAELAFLPATIALKIMPAPTVARVPGGPPELRGVALVDGDMIAIVAAADAPDHSAMLVCSVLGEKIGLVGIQIVDTGRFEAADGGDVRVNGEVARAFDVARLIARVREGRWAATLPE